jgi:hypothetical protein
MRWRTGQNDHTKRTFVFVALAASVAAGSSSAARHDTRNAVTQVYLGTKFYGSITFVPPHDGYLTTWKLSQRIQMPSILTSASTSAASSTLNLRGTTILWPPAARRPCGSSTETITALEPDVRKWGSSVGAPVQGVGTSTTVVGRSATRAVATGVRRGSPSSVAKTRINARLVAKRPSGKVARVHARRTRRLTDRSRALRRFRRRTESTAGSRLAA